MVLARLRPVDGALALLALAVAVGVALLRGTEAREAAADATPAAGGAVDAPPYAALVNGLPDPILVISAQEADDLTARRYIFANSAARELLRMQEGQGRLVSAIRDPQVLEAVDEALFGGLDAETVYEMGGTQNRVLRAYARPLGLALDGGRLALLMLRDETEARQVERTRSDFLANASHELRTPLASLTGFIETLRGHARDDIDARDRFLGIMQAQAERMSRLIADLMSLSRIELNEHIAPGDRVDLASAVADVLDAVGVLARERQIVLETDLPPRGEALVSGDRDQIVQVAQNLVDNAMKYSAPGATVRVSVVAGLSAEAAAQGGRPDMARLSLLTPDHSGGAYAVLRIADQGPGIARENLPRLTERFYRVEGQKSGERSGTGLGLAIVKHIANRHRGGLAVESAPGEGTAFSVYFRLAPEATATVGDGRRETVI
jgi:two-component system phosphate regulon sensor histidine kinase PhoR